MIVAELMRRLALSPVMGEEDWSMASTPSTKTEFAWHIHHNVLVEVLTEPIDRFALTEPIDKFAGMVDRRAAYIKAAKPKGEQKLRLRLLKQVKGRLPEAFVEASVALQAACASSYNIPHRGQTIDLAAAKLYQVRQQNMAAINVLHRRECPDCPWDARRRTIFSVGGK